MRMKSLALAVAVLSLPLAAALPADAKTAYQYWAQGQGAYVTSTDHPPFELQDFLVGVTPPYPDGAYGGDPGYVAQPYGYGYGYGYDDPAF